MTTNPGGYHASRCNCRLHPSIPRIIVAGKRSQAGHVALRSRPVGVAAVDDLWAGSQCRILLADQGVVKSAAPNLIDAMSHDAAVLKHVTAKAPHFECFGNYFRISEWCYVVAAAPPTPDAMIH